MISNCTGEVAHEKFFEVSSVQEFRFIVTGYSEAKDEILRLRNANRPISQDGGYLDWRYQRLQGAPEPIIFWIITESGQRVGMASLIFRRYWIDGTPTFFAVLGDISLDANMRGMGLGQRLLQYATDYITANLPETIAFVIPNDAAKKSLNAAGWKTVGYFVPYVFLLNPSAKLLRFFRIKWLISALGRVFSNLTALILALKVQKECSIHLVDRLDGSFESFWENYPKAHIIKRDSGVASLYWRFLHHPLKPIQIARADRAGEMFGFVAFKVCQDDGEVFIYDIVVDQVKYLKCIVALFVLKCREFENICTIRFISSDSNPVGNNLSRLGFLRRKSQTVFQIHSGSCLVANVTFDWALTWGDKDI